MSIKIKLMVAPNMLQENSYIITDSATSATAVIDPGFCSNQMLKYIEDNGGLKYIILTHAHGDHIAGIPELKAKYPDVKLVAHFNEQEMLSDSDVNGAHELFGVDITGDVDIYVTDGETMQLGDSLVKFIHTPGHTTGGMCILIDDNLFSGDTLFMRSVGRTDLYGGDWDELKASIRDKLFTLPDKIKVFPGHGPDTSIGYEKRVNPFV